MEWEGKLKRRVERIVAKVRFGREIEKENGNDEVKMEI